MKKKFKNFLNTPFIALFMGTVLICLFCAYVVMLPLAIARGSLSLMTNSIGELVCCVIEGASEMYN